MGGLREHSGHFALCEPEQTCASRSGGTNPTGLVPKKGCTKSLVRHNELCSHELQHTLGQ
jgi:hypothetical protein